METSTNYLLYNQEIESFNRKFEENTLTNQHQNAEYRNDIKNTFEFIEEINSDEVKNLKDKILELYYDSDKTSKPSKNVLNETFKLIDKLNPIALQKLSSQNIYISPYATIIFDWEKNFEDVFSLEIGSSQIGYFIEVQNKDWKQVDAANPDTHFKTLIKDLMSFLNY